MSFVKIGGEGSGEAAAEAALQDLAQVGAIAGGETVAQVAGGAAAAAHAASAIGTLLQAGSEGSGQGQVAAATPGIAGGAAGAGIGGGGAAGATPGFAGGGAAGAAGGGGVLGASVAGVVGSVFGAPGAAAAGVVGAIGGMAGGLGGAAAGIVGTVGGIGGVAGGLKGGAVGGISGAAAGIAAAVGVSGSVGTLLGGAAGAGAIGGIPGMTGGIAGGAGGIPGVPGGIVGAASGGIAGIAGKAGLGSASELPIFEDIAVTSMAPSDAVSALEDELQGVIDFGTAGVFGPLAGRNLEVEVASGDALDIRQFSIHERMSSLFQVQLIVLTDNHDIDFDSVVGHPAKFTIHTNPAVSAHEPRVWTGVCSHFQQVATDSDGLSTYQLSLVPDLWLATQRRNYRMFQQITEPDIVLKLLKEWEIEPEVRIDKGAYKKRKYRVQYGESDFAFLSRMLEDAGISFFFEQKDGATKLVLSDSPQKNKPRPRPLRFFDSPTGNSERFEHATHVRVSQLVRPGKYTIRDHDYRMPPSYKLVAEHAAGKGVENKLERFHYSPGAFLFGTDKGDATPSADDKGKSRTDQSEGNLLAQKRLEAKRGDAKIISFETNAPDVGPGMVLSFLDHPRSDLGKGKKLLVIESAFTGSSTGEWHKSCEARSADVAYRPPMDTPKPKVAGIESATVVGPPGEEIHTDEFGRVRCHFHWDRESKMDDNSSCWIHVSQPWGGSGYGGMNLPRVGQEVIVDFLGGDPDRPVIVGRLYTNLQKVPYKLPQDKTKSGWKSNSTNKTGGYNEMMFEDAAGKELINIQAQKDLHKLVKHDEKETTGNDRTITVVHDRSATIGNNDTASVGVLHSVTITPAPPGGMGPPAPATTSVTMIDKKIVLTTKEATITIDGPTITLDADTNIKLESRGTIDIHAAGGIKMKSDSGNIVVRGDPQVKINCSE